MYSVTATLLHPITRFIARSAAGMVAVVATATGFGALLASLQLGWPPFERLDWSVLVALNDAITDLPKAATILSAFTVLGSNVAMWWLVTVAAAGVLIRRQPRIAAYFVATGFGALAITPLTKSFVGWLQPRGDAATAIGQEHVFPSEYAVNATVILGAVLLVVLPIIPRRFRRLAIAVVGALVMAIGITRARLDMQYASDVVAGWLLGLAWLAVTTYAFRLWQAETGMPQRPLSQGLASEAAPQLASTRIVALAHPWLAVAKLAAGLALIAAVLFGLGKLLVSAPPAFDEAVPQWLAAHRSSELNDISYFWSSVGGTRGIIAAGVIIAPLAVAYVRHWRPAVFLSIVLVGEVALFLTVAALVGRSRPDVTQLDGPLPTAAFPSGHVAATACLYGALAVLVVPRTRGWRRWLAIAVAVLMPVMVALSRVYRGEHHPLDIAGGILLAALWLTVVTLFVRPNADLHQAHGSASTSPASLASAPPASPDAGVGIRDTVVVPDETNCYAWRPSAGRRSAVVANPSKMANPAARRAEIAAAFAGAGWPEPMWLETTPEEPGAAQARQVVESGIDLILAAGGDGTVMACASAVVGTDVALAVLPFGTGNLLAANLNLPSRVPAAVAVATGHGRRHVDVGMVGDRCFTVMAGMGFDAQMLHDAPAALKARIGWTAYAVAALRHLCETPMNVDISLDHNPPMTREARTVLIGNVGRLRGGVRLLRDAEPDDGLLHIAVLMVPKRRDWLRLAWALLRHRPTRPNMEVFNATHVTITSDRRQPRELDGDLIEPSDTLTAAVRPGALWLCVPQDSPNGVTTGSTRTATDRTSESGARARSR
jgi:undecaprenyl-diphosphatase